MSDGIYRATIICRLCHKSAQVEAVGVDASDPFPDADVEAEIDRAVVEQAERQGIRRVQIGHMPTTGSKYARNPWICADCATAILKVFSVAIETEATKGELSR